MTLLTVPAGAQRFLVNTAATLTTYKLDQYGEPADPGATTVVVTGADGSAVASGSATETAGTHQLSYALTASQNDQLDWLKAVWTADATSWTTYHEVVGGFYFSTAQAKASDPATFGSYSVDDLLALRDEVEREFEKPQTCGRAFVPRFMRERVFPDCGSELYLSQPDLRSVRSVVAVDSDGSTWEPFEDSTVAVIPPSEDGVACAYGFSWPRQPVIVEYEYGLDRPPADLLRAILRRLRYLSSQNSTGVPDRAVTFSAGQTGGTYGLAVEGRAGFITALPDVDLLIKRYRARPSVG